MKTKFLRVTTEDKLILQGLLYEPDKKTDNVILHIHGMAGNFYENRFLDAMAKVFTDNNFAFLSPNTRGHDYIADFPIEGTEDKYRRIGNTFEKFEESVLDIKCWMNFAEKHFSHVILQGHSLGCSKVVYYLSQTKDPRVEKLILASPADMVGLTEKGSYHKEMMELSRKWIKQGKGKQILPKLLDGWAYLSADTYVDFHTRGNPIDVFNTYDRNARSRSLENIKVPILAFFGTAKDTHITQTPKEALEIIKNKTKTPKFTSGIVNGAPHSYFEHEKEVADRIINWLKNGDF